MSSPQRPSSPLAFPSSSPAINAQTDDVSSPLRFPQTSSPTRPTPSRRASSIHNGSSDLFLGSQLGRQPTTPRTPRFRRGDLHASQDVPRQFNPEPTTGSADPNTSQANDPTNATRIIWGTLVDIQESTNTFKKFLRLFKLRTRLEAEGRSVTPADNEPFYPKLLTQLKRQESYNLNLDCANLRAYPGTRKLYEQLIKYPQELIPLMDYTLSEFFCELFDLDEYDEQNRGFKVRPYNLKESVNMRNLNPSDIDKLVTVKGILIRASTIIPDLKQAFFRCLECDHAVTVGIDRGKITEPTRCPREACKSLNTMSLIHNRCDFTDKQICRLQETPDAIPDGQTPHTVSLCMYDDLVDVAKPGDRLEVTGIFRSIPVRVNPRMRTIKTLFKTYLDVVHIQKSDKRRMAIDATLSSANEFAVEYDESDEIRDATEDDEKKIQDLSLNPNIYEILAKSLAPSIYELDDIKKGILLQLFGGTNKTFKKAGAPRYRGDINVLLVGDPGTSKSQMLTYVHNIAPRGVYTSGKGSSAVGLTAYVTRDPDTKQLVLESGALVLSDGGVCCIDEFDKMSEATRSVLHEVMEQQTVSVAKAGIITTLNARTSILACANPKFSRWNPRLPIPQNIDLPPTLLSRFDLVYILLDKPDENADRRLARHLVSLYLEDVPSNVVPDTIPVELLTKYIGYARRKVHPTITDGAEKLLIESYVQLRSLGENSRGANSRVTATTRQLESMIRLSEAHARMRLSPRVEEYDVEEACRLLREAIKEYATDPATGLIDMDMINTGTSSFARSLLNDLQRELQRLISSKTATMIKWTGLFKELSEQSSLPINARDFETALENLQQDGIIKVSGSRENRVIRRIQGPNEGSM